MWYEHATHSRELRDMLIRPFPKHQRSGSQQSCNMNGFERHGITRLSPSTLNHFAAEPAHWVMQRLLNMRAPVSAAAARGTAVEWGVHQGLIKPTCRSTTASPPRKPPSTARWRSTPTTGARAERAQHPRLCRERAHRAAPVRRADALRRTGSRSGSTTCRCRSKATSTGVFDEHGLIVDLKTRERLPSAISDTHGRQGAVYAKAHGNYGMRFAYVKPVAGKKDGRAGRRLRDVGRRRPPPPHCTAADRAPSRPFPRPLLRSA